MSKYGCMPIKICVTLKFHFIKFSLSQNIILLIFLDHLKQLNGSLTTGCGLGPHWPVCQFWLKACSICSKPEENRQKQIVNECVFFLLKNHSFTHHLREIRTIWGKEKGEEALLPQGKHS